MSGDDYKLETAEVKTSVVRAFHRVCGGELVATGEAFMTMPPQYAHHCKKCGVHLAIAGGAQYPAIQYRAYGEQSLDNQPCSKA